tara:strand:+ start:38 stop:550 length:513 start_codon:yes stop_codon:yes gene_type:complete
MKIKPLPPLEELKEVLDYNPDTGIIIWKKKVRGNVEIGQEAGSVNSKGYRIIKFKRKQYLAHRIAYYMYHGIDPLEKKLLDHENLNKQDNWIKNLRLATHQENGRNRNLNKNNTSGATGVGWHKIRRKWEAHIKVNFKKKFLGFFVNKEDAIQARKEGEKKYFGKFRRLD